MGLHQCCLQVLTINVAFCEQLPTAVVGGALWWHVWCSSLSHRYFWTAAESPGGKKKIIIDDVGEVVRLKI
jgi:hypothetical protein